MATCVYYISTAKEAAVVLLPWWSFSSMVWSQRAPWWEMLALWFLTLVFFPHNFLHPSVVLYHDIPIFGWPFFATNQSFSFEMVLKEHYGLLNWVNVDAAVLARIVMTLQVCRLLLYQCKYHCQSLLLFYSSANTSHQVAGDTCLLDGAVVRRHSVILVHLYILPVNHVYHHMDSMKTCPSVTFYFMKN